MLDAIEDHFLAHFSQIDNYFMRTTVPADGDHRKRERAAFPKQWILATAATRAEWTGKWRRSLRADPTPTARAQPRACPSCGGSGLRALAGSRYSCADLACAHEFGAAGVRAPAAELVTVG